MITFVIIFKAKYNRFEDINEFIIGQIKTDAHKNLPLGSNENNYK